MKNLKKLFLLDPDVIFLNHGSFGACPRPVFKAYQAWQRRFERQPVLFVREWDALDLDARLALGEYLHASADDLTFVTNATFAVNLVARSLDLHAGDEILTTDHEYGACDNTWEYICWKSGARYIHQPVRLPPADPEQMVDEFWQGVTPRTKLIYLSHITSPTAMRLPVEAIVQRARQKGILAFIDGAHAPGQIPLDLEALGADFYTGNCHKWMLSPKGAGFLYARGEHQGTLVPLVISHPFAPEKYQGVKPDGLGHLAWTGTRDPSAMLAVPAAIQFMKQYHWEEVTQECHLLLKQALSRVSELTGLEPVYPLESGYYSQMGVAALPPIKDPEKLKTRLYDEYRIEVPVFSWGKRVFIRISVQGYNGQEDIDALLHALTALIPQMDAVISNTTRRLDNG